MPGGSSRLGINTGRCRKAAQRASPFRERLATQDSSPTRPPPRGKGSRGQVTKTGKADWSKNSGVDGCFPA